ncbi:hypothetical protein A3H87_02025 [Candidatus Curtissbacteria bacterium RIFCSPLOWO2_02_FULL_42_37]|uniref:Uncharacterized protein n=1 Tax=Candidatus Curtissbacteria bacterium RIFCSPLOWO2_01_FULL_42_50 TaxID=1797730 RepID=A0A1F5H2E1_9BACT|nr:MAG: hypothetical protein A3B54_04105 [Candidatus Curtissbacteria bacterium RIFCSPLOWO2_01_FULL_42_50]OGE10343.1 MAG: hypothetical protein A3H87_02025 [Candidatus Curtissbacteria bacterium RIFCSPLOWO2_02_FULL_42_37]
MDFPYTLVTDWPKHQARQRYLPWINIGIRKPGTIKTVWPLGLVDSRAELTVIDHEIGKELGLNFKKAIKNTITGFGGAKVQVLIAEVEFVIDDGRGKEPTVYQDFAGFTANPFPAPHPQQTAIFGTVGLFRKVNEVSFEYPRRIHIK